jgi:hypothetical protein
MDAYVEEGMLPVERGCSRWRGDASCEEGMQPLKRGCSREGMVRTEGMMRRGHAARQSPQLRTEGRNEALLMEGGCSMPRLPREALAQSGTLLATLLAASQTHPSSLAGKKGA